MLWKAARQTFPRYNRVLLCSHVNVDSKSKQYNFTKQKATIVRDVTTPAAAAFVEPKPFSEIPLSGGHWLSNVLEVFFRHGGIHYALYKIQENMIREHGPICRRANALGEEVFLADPADVKAVFSLEPKHPKRFKAPIFDDFYVRENKDPGVFFLNGEKWRRHKMLLSKKMLRPPQMNAYIPRIDDVASDAVNLIKRERNSAGSLRPWEVDEIKMELFKWSFETVTDFLFDRRFHCLSENPPQESLDFIKAVGLFLDNVFLSSILPPQLYKYIQTKPFKKFNSNFLALYKFADELIEERLQRIAKNQSQRDPEANSGLIPFLLSSEHFNENELPSSIVDTLFAGVDTTSNTMQWMLYLLAKNPDVQKEIQDEIKAVVPSGVPLTEDLLHKLPLVKAAIKETLRLHPVLILTARTLPCDTVIRGYHIPANTSIMFMHHGMGRREDLFTNAESFIPKRWLRDNNRLNIDAFASIPFGFGVRMCLGRRLAELELQILLIKILQNFKLEISEGHEVYNYMRGTNVPNKSIRVQFRDLK